MSRTINVALTRIKAQLDDRDHRLGELHAELSVDPVTQLAARAQFMDRLAARPRVRNCPATAGPATGSSWMRLSAAIASCRSLASKRIECRCRPNAEATSHTSWM